MSSTIDHRTTSGQPIRPLDGELQADPQLREGRASGTRIAVYAAAIAIVIGGVVYGLAQPDVLHDPAKAGMTP